MNSAYAAFSENRNLLTIIEYEHKLKTSIVSITLL